MIKKTLCTVFSAMFLFVSIPTFAASSKYQKESKHFILDIEDKYFDGNISPEKLLIWLDKLDASYEALEELYGKPESTKKIRIKSATLDSVTRFFYDYDNFSPLIEWCDDDHKKCIIPVLRRIDRSDEFLDKLLFAISDFFTGINESYAGWIFDRYTFDQLSVDYLSESGNWAGPGLGVCLGNDGLYSSSPSYTFESMARKLAELKDKIGSWDPFKKVFRAFSSGSIDEIRDYSRECTSHSNEMHCRYDIGYLNPFMRFNVFMNELSKQGYADEVNNLFTPAQMDAIESYLSPKISLETKRVESNYSDPLSDRLF